MDRPKASRCVRYLAKNSHQECNVELLVREGQCASVPLRVTHVAQTRPFDLLSGLFQHLSLKIEKYEMAVRKTAGNFGAEEPGPTANFGDTRVGRQTQTFGEP